MNKILFAHVLAGALALPLAAQAQTGSVSLYGRVNLDFEFVNGRQADGSNPTVNRVSNNSSRFGMRGTESLGGGLNAFFQLESSVNADTNAGNLGGRETFAGLQGPWGQVYWGSFLTPYYDDVVPVFANTTVLQTSILSTEAHYGGGINQTKANGGFTARLGNSIRYKTPDLSGFVAEAQYSTRDSSGTTGANTGDHPSELRHAYVISLAGNYKNGPLAVGVGYERNREVRAPSLNDNAFSIAGAYDFGTILQGFGLRVGAVYERLKYETPTGDLKRDFWGVSAAVPVGGGKLTGFYGRAGDGKGGATDGTAVGDIVKGSNTGSAQWELTYAYPLSLRTLLYTGYVKIINEAAASVTLAINPYTIAPGAKPGGFAMGMVHFF